jgi:hypothetical protein
MRTCTISWDTLRVQHPVVWYEKGGRDHAGAVTTEGKVSSHFLFSCDRQLRMDTSAKLEVDLKVVLF